MQRYPVVPDVDEVDPSVFDGGHLWVQELVAGEPFRFQVQSSGALRVGTQTREFDASDAPLRFQDAVQYVRDELDGRALREAVADVESVTFVGVATVYDGVPYDWTRTPSVVTVDVHDATRDTFLAVDATEQALERFGLAPTPVVAKEVHVRDFDFDDPSMPASDYYDGPAAGLVVRKKTGERVAFPNPDLERVVPREEPVPANAADAAARTVTSERLERAARTARDRDYGVTFDAVYDRVLATIYREEGDWLLDGDTGAGFDLGAFRNAVAERTSAFVDTA
jgi:hypothetical protein